ncbi:hypothetical protein ACIVBQ_000428 [Tenacibaculum discolor]
MKKYKSLQVILVILTTFFIAFLTSLLLELELFKSVVRYILVCLLIVIELIIGGAVLFFNLKKIKK